MDVNLLGFFSSMKPLEKSRTQQLQGRIGGEGENDGDSLDTLQSSPSLLPLFFDMSNSYFLYIFYKVP